MLFLFPGALLCNRYLSWPPPYKELSNSSLLISHFIFSIDTIALLNYIIDLFTFSMFIFLLGSLSPWHRALILYVYHCIPRAGGAFGVGRH
jgi:hypothetical protein